MAVGSGPSSIVPVASYSACELAWHIWGHQVVALSSGPSSIVLVE